MEILIALLIMGAGAWLLMRGKTATGNGELPPSPIDEPIPPLPTPPPEPPPPPGIGTTIPGSDTTPSGTPSPRWTIGQTVTFNTDDIPAGHIWWTGPVLKVGWDVAYKSWIYKVYNGYAQNVGGNYFYAAEEALILWN